MRNLVVLLIWGCILRGVFSITFVMDKEECFSLKIENGATVHYSFVVIGDADYWEKNDSGVDLVVKGPSGEQINDFRDKISEKSEFLAHHEGVYRFCFTSKSRYHETIDFDVHADNFTYDQKHAKDEHFKPLYEHIGKLEEALYNIQYEQHWLEAQTQRQTIVNKGMSRKATQKALFESLALVGASILQVFLLHRLFDRKLDAQS
ncbi:hypothetical protein Leryth_005708 [Lithospermum erythrorhizon]|nr:hypothetical protein Leryth_005708 [Lithospermum erythrorhizon]